MAFPLADVKKTVRSRADGERYLHPKLLSGAAVEAQVGMALSYFHARVGRARRDIDPELLVRFLGNPKIARGLISCLNASYRWRLLDFSEVLEPVAVARLQARSLHTPGDLRIYLYDAVNAAYAGFLPSEREEHLRPLARRLRLSTAKLDQLAALDAEENAVLVRVGPAPTPEQIVELYNFQVVDALLRNSQYVELHRISDESYPLLAEACEAYEITLERDGETARLHNRPDTFGNYARWGIRLTRAIYSAGSILPTLLTAGRARVALPGKHAWYLFDRETRLALTAGTRQIHCASSWPEAREAWDRQRTASGTAGWRLQGMPEPVLSHAGLALAPFAVRRDEAQVLIWPVRTRTALDDLSTMHLAGMAVLGVADATMADAMPESTPWIAMEEGAAGLVNALRRYWDEPRMPAGQQALDTLIGEVAVRGFIEETQVMEMLSCVSTEDLAKRLMAVDPARGAYVQGLGFCSPSFADSMRKGLRYRAQRPPAA